MNTIEILSHIGRQNKEIDSFSFHTFPAQRLLQTALPDWNKEEEDMFGFALKMREQYRLPFWDSMMLGTFGNCHYSKKIMEAALYHNPIKDLFYLKSADIQKNGISLDNTKRMAVCSQVLMKDGSIRHIPMIDFHIPVSDINVSIAKEVCSLLKLHQGYLLNSGESYHYIGSYTVGWDDLCSLLSRALLFCPIIDRAWISHQLTEKSCSLRIDKKNGRETACITEL